MSIPAEVQHTLDAASIGVAVASLFDFLPHIGALLSVIWLSLRIYGELVDRGFVKGKRKGDEQ